MVSAPCLWFQKEAHADLVRSSSMRSSGSISPRSNVTLRSSSFRKDPLSDARGKPPFSSMRTTSPSALNQINKSADAKQKDSTSSAVEPVPGGFKKTEFSTRKTTTKLSNGKSATLATTSTIVTTKCVINPSKAATIHARVPPDGENGEETKTSQPKRGSAKEAIQKWNAASASTKAKPQTALMSGSKGTTSRMVTNTGRSSGTTSAVVGNRVTSNAQKPPVSKVTDKSAVEAPKNISERLQVRVYEQFRGRDMVGASYERLCLRLVEP